LNVNDLRVESYPLDWQMLYSLDTVIHLFKTGFNDFFVEIEEDYGDAASNHRRIRDVANDITNIHHFSIDETIEKSQAMFLEKMKERFERLDEKLMKAEKLFFLCNRKESIEDLQDFVIEFSRIYSHLEVKLLNVRNDSSISSELYKNKIYKINDKLSVEECVFNDVFDSAMGEKFDWRGNIKVWRAILKDYFIQDKYESMQVFKMKSASTVIYGAGKRAQSLIDKLEKYDARIKGIAVTDTSNNLRTIGQYWIKSIEEYDKTDDIIITLSDENEVRRIKIQCVRNGYVQLYCLDSNLNILRCNIDEEF